MALTWLNMPNLFFGSWPLPTLCQISLWMARQEEAATNQQFPRRPCLTSPELVPSTKNLGFSHICWKKFLQNDWSINQLKDKIIFWQFKQRERGERERAMQHLIPLVFSKQHLLIWHQCRKVIYHLGGIPNLWKDFPSVWPLSWAYCNSVLYRIVWSQSKTFSLFSAKNKHVDKVIFHDEIIGLASLWLVIMQCLLLRYGFCKFVVNSNSKAEIKNWFKCIQSKYQRIACMIILSSW